MRKILLLVLSICLCAVPLSPQSATAAAQPASISEDFSKAALNALITINAYRGAALDDKEVLVLLLANKSEAMSALMVEEAQGSDQEGQADRAVYKALDLLEGRVEVSAPLSEDCVTGLAAQLRARSFTGLPSSCPHY